MGDVRTTDSTVDDADVKSKQFYEVVVVGELPYNKEKDADSVVSEKKVEKHAHFDVKNVDFTDAGPKWADMSTGARVWKITTVVAGILFALGLLYIFICSLDILTSAFQLLAGRVASETFTNSVILNNPIACLMLGVLVTVLLQSSSTSTSIVVTLVGSGILTVEQGIYVVMGANIGTSVTNTIVSLTQSVEVDVFRRSFAGATVHDMFNWLTVLILLPLEVVSGYLEALTGAIVKNIKPSDTYTDEPQFLKVITDPLTKRIVKVDKGVLTAVAEETDKAKYPICQYYCEQEYTEFETAFETGVNETYVDIVKEMPWTIDITVVNDTTNSSLSWLDINNQSEVCTHLFTGCGGKDGVDGEPCNLSDEAVGGILFACSLTVLLSSVIIMVKVLNSILKGPMAHAIRKGVNSNLPGKAAFLTGYIAMLVGAGLTMLVQSSSVFTSTLTPLVGMGLISVERMFPLTLGANIGTCLTGILAALASDPTQIQNTMQVALAHLFFNITGIVIYYPIPFMRRIPLTAAYFMGNETAKYRWFAVMYIILVFLLIPLGLFGLSLAGWKVMVGVIVPIAALVVAIAVIKIMQNYCPMRMHPKMRNWKWLPEPLRSLAPLNKVVTRCCYNEKCINCRRKCCGGDSDTDSDSDEEAGSAISEVVAVNTQSPHGVAVIIGEDNDAYETMEDMTHL